MIGIKRQYMKGIEAMDEKIEIKKQDFYEMMYLMEKILYIAERSGAREDSDNNAYSLAITFGKENVVQELLSLRRKMNDYLDEQGEAELWHYHSLWPNARSFTKRTRTVLAEEGWGIENI